MALTRTGVELVAAGEAQFNAALKRADANVQQFAAGAKSASAGVNAAGASMAQTAQKVDQFGRNARIGLSSVSQAAKLLGSDLSSVIGPAAGAADAIGDIVGSAAMLGGVGVAFTGLSLVIGLVINRLQEQEKASRAATEALVKGYADAHAELQKFLAIDPLKGLAESLGVSVEGLRAYVKANYEAAQSANQLVAVQETILVLEARLAEARARSAEAAERLAQAQQYEASGIGTASQEIEIWTGQLNSANADIARYSNALGVARAANEQMTGSIQGSVTALESQASAMQLAENAARAAAENGTKAVEDWNLRVEQAQQRVKRAMGIIEDPIDKWEHDQITAYQNSQAAAKEWARKTEEAQKKIRDSLRSLTEAALAPTKVTDADTEAAKLGKYVDKWDEWRRRAEAVLTGTDPMQFGEQFAKSLETLDMPLDEAIRKYENFSLFVGGAHIDLVNFNAIVAQVEEQLLGMAGKAALTEAALAEVWAKLSPSALGALKTQGIENAEDALKQLVDPAGAAKDKVTDLNAEIGQTPVLKITTFDIKKAATFDPTLARIIEDLNYIPDSADVVVTLTYETRGAPPGGTPPPPPPGTPPHEFQHGGTGIFARDQSIYVHRGEGYWFSGMDWTTQFPASFERRISHPASISYGDSTFAPNIAVSVQAQFGQGAGRSDVDYLANRVATQIRDRLLTYRRARA